MHDEKLQKVLARSGFGSRREMERWIESGRITLNDHPATLGDRVTAEDRVCVDGKEVELTFSATAERRVLVYNKPLGEVCTRHDPEGRPTVFDNLPPLKQGRWVAIGRLDINTSGLLIFTTDGELANCMMHPSMQIDREYAVRVLGDVDEAMLERLKQGVLLDDGMARFTDVRYFDGEGANKWYHCVVMEGRNREVRRLWESQGLQVNRLKRVRFGPVFLPSDIKVGTWRELAPKEVDLLSKEVGLDVARTHHPTPLESEKEKRLYKRQRVRQEVIKGQSEEEKPRTAGKKRSKARSVGKRNVSRRGRRV
ncbi:23S rRNA pseudouridine(2605) synthase RluB [Marinobacterium sediminicola]|uniref:Pseudouridine synthase n=1 Tax=Marinobacterium sediminicola TaxID=518898 RepID=A0ABY1S080_9GAMM|nr:pseudouridine synthase [Marinobacterium sediminicola]ULG70023.1 pseudouridine synthase [Marinobacterium sediminicola]SMR74477.1 ribosomal large subunit pseudouridine synthase B [Marinobacterium sediminicola]